MSASVAGTRPASRRRTVGRLVAAAAVGAAAGIALWPQDSAAVPRTVEGWASPNADGTVLSLRDSPQVGSGNSYVVAGVQWSGPDGVMHHGEVPTCVGTDTSAFTRVELGMVTVDPGDGAVGWDQVVWLRCLD